MANMFSQIDQKQIPLKKAMKSRPSVDSLDSLDSVETLQPEASAAEGGEGVRESHEAGEKDPPQIQPNANMNSIVEELEKRFPSQSTML